ncbi:hypothetical protein SPURM210S_05064 [Streptomyces purpurascens]
MTQWTGAWWALSFNLARTDRPGVRPMPGAGDFASEWHAHDEVRGGGLCCGAWSRSGRGL